MRRTVETKRGVVAVLGRLREQMQDDFAIDGGLENRAARFEFVAELGGVSEIAVVRDGDLAALAIHRERLGIAEFGRAGGGVARVSDRHSSRKFFQRVGLEDLRHEAHAEMRAELSRHRR